MLGMDASGRVFLGPGGFVASPPPVPRWTLNPVSGIMGLLQAQQRVERWHSRYLPGCRWPAQQELRTMLLVKIVIFRNSYD
jgi:hypothetical protein